MVAMATEDLDLEAEYNNRARVPDHLPTLPDGSGMRPPIGGRRAASLIWPMDRASAIGSISSIRRMAMKTALS